MYRRSICKGVFFRRSANITTGRTFEDKLKNINMIFELQRLYFIQILIHEKILNFSLYFFIANKLYISLR